MAESTPLENIDTGKKENHVRYFTKVFYGHNGEEINKTIKESTGNQSIVFTDKSTSYVDISEFEELCCRKEIKRNYCRNFEMGTYCY
jgi:transposase-like protein